MKSYIILENATFYAKHGVFSQETTVGNVFVVNLKVEVDLSKSCMTDGLDDTISYAHIFEEVKREMAIPSKLIEHVAFRIIRCLKDKYPEIKTVEIKLSKRNPPMGGQVEYASVVLID